MRLTPRRTALVVLPAFAVLAMGCSRDREADEATGEASGSVKVAFDGDSTRMPALGPGDVRIVSTDGAFVMAVIGDTVRMQLSDSLRQKVSHDIDTAGAAKGGFGAAIASSVNKVVGGAMGFVVRVPVQDVENLRYENGRLRFDVRGGKVQTNGTNNSGNAEFTEEDARRFIDAVERRKKETGVAM